MSDFAAVFKSETQYAEEVVLSYLPAAEGFQKTVLDAMHYSVRAGGKRLRPLLIRNTYRLFGGNEKICEPFMAAMEYIHTYSLIHDDLPAMDNDDLRRGKPTCHKVFGEDMAILAGDALLNYAFETAFCAFALIAEDKKQESYEHVAEALSVLGSKAGIHGMVGGQTVDVENDGKPITEEQLTMIYENKTGALLEASMMIGAILSGASSAEVETIRDIASDIGIAFQIQDDILDVIGDKDILGKPIGSDNKNNKITYVTIHGLDAASEKVAALTEHANALLDGLMGTDDEVLSFMKDLFQWLVHRNN